jgi:DNA (cytosine-5)-methyltransferase 1
MRALDLFCGAGGASAGLVAAGFEVVGVDVEPQPEYPFAFVQADALEFPLDGFDFVWASPKCQAFTAYRRRPDHVRPVENQIPVVRAHLRASGAPHVIENVPGAPLESPVTLCGSMFGLDVKRHRCFETSFPVAPPPCDHGRWAPRFPCATNRKNLRKTVEVGVYRIPLDVQRRAMGIGWMSLGRLSQAVPPAYAEFLARAFLSWREAGGGVADGAWSEVGSRRGARDDAPGGPDRGSVPQSGGRIA